jgi:hypothetical protein
MRTAPARLFLACVVALWAGLGSAPARAQVYITTLFKSGPLIDRWHISRGPNAVIDSKDGKTPLMLAVEGGDVESIVYLLEQGAELSIRDTNGESALDIARRLHEDRIQQILASQLSLHPEAADFYAGKNPIITIKAGQYQSAYPGDCLEYAFTVSVTEARRPLANAPVRFTVGGDGGQLITSPVSPESDELTLRTDPRGLCRVYFVTPHLGQFRSLVRAQVGVPGSTRQVVFVASGDNDEKHRRLSPFDVSNSTANADNDGTGTFSWRNRFTEASAIKIQLRKRDGTWEALAILPPGTTTVTIPNAWADY